MHSYLKVYRYIFDQIQDGSLKEGDPIPKEMDLSALFKISRPTVRQAMNKLVNDGYLKRTKGRGSFVTKPKVLQEYTRFIESYNHEMEKKGLLPDTKVLEMSLTFPNENVQKQLAINEDERIVKLKRLRFIKEGEESKPIILTTVFFPYSILPNAFQYDFEKLSFYDVLNESGIKIQKVMRILEIKFLSENNSKLFGLSENLPCHFISSVGYDSENRPIEYSENFYPADRNKFIIEISQ